MVNIYMLLGLFIGIIVGIIIEKYVFPYLDIKFEKYTYSESVICTEHQIKAKEMVKEFDKKYPNEEIPELQPAIGFEIPSHEDEYYDDECKDKSKNENKIGFKNNY